MQNDVSWHPTASMDTLRQRARLICRTREYFLQQSVLEVETPVLSHFGGTDVNLEQWRTESGMSLHTSPEFAMKRLLAAGSGDIYQLCRVFRQDEVGVRHNPEFTMLEWYRVNMDEHQLMQDVVRLIEFISETELNEVDMLTYSDAFSQCGLPHPLLASDGELKAAVTSLLAADTGCWNRDDCLGALMSLVVEPSLSPGRLSFIYQYPASQAAMARHMPTDDGTVARRFELYWQGMELANGYYELVDAEEQARRFDQENKSRLQQGKQAISQDVRLLSALKAGLPSCSGVALGLDRLIMILLGKGHIQEVIAFPFDRA